MQQSNPKDRTSHVASAARRRILKVGLAAVPTMLTLKSKPVFGAGGACASLSLSAAQSHGVVGMPGCNQNSFK